jgi:aminoglycoside phosphotransferase (APT) family kinase protein
MTSADVTAIRPGHEFDVDRLGQYLASRLEGVSGVLSARQFRGGQSNTYLSGRGRRPPSGRRST